MFEAFQAWKFYRRIDDAKEGECYFSETIYLLLGDLEPLLMTVEGVPVREERYPSGWGKTVDVDEPTHLNLSTFERWRRVRALEEDENVLRAIKVLKERGLRGAAGR